MFAKYTRVGARTCMEHEPHSPIHESTSALGNRASRRAKQTPR
jgi:hypothetical protein